VVFEKVFAASDGSGVTFSPAVPARANHIGSDQYFKLHLSFIPQTTRNKTTVTPAAPDAEDPQSDPESDPESDQVRQIAELIRSYRPAMEEARAAGGKYRIGVLAHRPGPA